MYQTNKWSNNITEKEIIKSTDKTVTYLLGNREYRENIISNYHRWHKTKDDAINCLKEKYLSRINWAEKEITEAKKNLELLTSIHLKTNKQ